MAYSGFGRGKGGTATAKGSKPLAGGLPPRTADTMSDAIAMSSPSGKMSNRARARANEDLRTKLFGKSGLRMPAAKSDQSAAANLQRAKQLRDLASRGMKPRAHIKEAKRLEALAAASRR